MTSKINSTGTSSGIAVDADASGVLELQGAGNTGVTVDATGNVGIGAAGVAGRALLVRSDGTGATTAYGVANAGTIQSDVTVDYRSFFSGANVADSAFTLGSLNHFMAGQGTIGASATVTTQIGFNATSSLIGATNNYGFYGNIASGANRWNFYAGGTAANYFAGATTFNAALTYGGVTLSNSVTGTGSMVLSASPTLTGTLTAATVTASGVVTALNATAVGAGANTQAFIKASSTANLGIYYGTGDPTFSAAKGSLYSKTDATTTTTRLWINTDGGTTWAYFTASA